MIQTFENADGKVIWYDAVEPDQQEILGLKEELSLDIPSLDEMLEIESSSRLFQEEGALHMTASLLSLTNKPYPMISPATFILQGDTLITIRHDEFKPFDKTIRKVNFRPPQSGESIFLELLDSLVARMADILEHAGVDIERISRDIFREKHAHRDDHKELHAIVLDLGKQGDLNSKCRESLASLQRLFTFFKSQVTVEKSLSVKFKSIQSDLLSVSDYITFISNKINFLLDATLGLINIEQNGIIKIFSVAAVIFLPPTLIASIYGMNFKVMPELHWTAGYPLTLVLMLFSAIAPYLFFKRKGWL